METWRRTHLDCQGVMTPSSGPPISTSFLILRKFFFHSEKENAVKSQLDFRLEPLNRLKQAKPFIKLQNDTFTHRECADLLNLGWLSHCWEEPNNHCYSRTGLCGEGLWGGGQRTNNQCVRTLVSEESWQQSEIRSFIPNVSTHWVSI